MSKTKKRMTAWLPPLSCTEETREELIRVAEIEGKSLSELQRLAIALFLSRYDTNTITNAPESFAAEIEHA